VNPVFAAALEVQTFCTARRFPFCFIGGVAVQRWGEPRQTDDVDLTLLAGFGNEEAVVDALLAEFQGREPDTRDFALVNRVVLLHSRDGVGVDVSLGAIPFEERTIQRSSAFAIDAGTFLTTCSAEDLVVHKAFADRTKDWMDIEGIVLRQAGGLNETQIFEELAPLLELKGTPEVETRLRRLLQAERPKPS
jgi:hypothetical protein